MLAPFAAQENLPWPREVQIRRVDTDCLRDAGTCPSKKEKKSIVAAPKGRLPIGGIQKGVDLGSR